MQPVVVMCSGGAESLVMASQAPRGSILLNIDWGQPAEREERRASAEIADRLGHRLASRRCTLPESPMHAPPGRGPRVVGGRNLVLCSLGVAVACAEGATEVWLGASGVDQESYPDCRAAFVEALSAASSLAYGVSVEAPLLGWERSRVVAVASATGIPWWSCYRPVGGKPCHKCDGCARHGALLAVRGGA